MSDKRMLIVDAELLSRIDENRGDMSRVEFIGFIIDSALGEDGGRPAGVKPNFVTREELGQYQQGIRDLLQSFLEFFINYGLEIGKQPGSKNFEEAVKGLYTSESKSKRS